MPTNFLNRPFTFDRLVRIGIAIALVWLAILALNYLSDVLIPFAVAFLFAYLLNPLVSFIQKKIRNRVLAILISLSFVFFVLFGITWLLIPLISHEVSHMGQLLSKLAKNSQLINQKSDTYLPQMVWEYVVEMTQKEEVRAWFNVDNFGELGLEMVKKIAPRLLNLFSGTVHIIGGIIGFALIMLYLIFILLDYEKMMGTWKNYLPAEWKDTVMEVVNDFTKGMSKYFRAQAVVASCVGVLFAIGFALIDLPLGIVLGLCIGLLNMVPYLQTLGIIPATLLAMVYSLETGTSFWQMLGLVLLVFLIVQTIQEAILNPKIMGEAIGLNPAVMLLSLSIWGKILGMLGLIIALPVSFLLLSYYKRLIKSLNEQVENNKVIK
jgi:predicted PurR-regulated permease PerM